MVLHSFLNIAMAKLWNEREREGKGKEGKGRGGEGREERRVNREKRKE